MIRMGGAVIIAKKEGTTSSQRSVFITPNNTPGWFTVAVEGLIGSTVYTTSELRELRDMLTRILRADARLEEQP